MLKPDQRDTISSDTTNRPTGVLLLQLGTPDSPTTRDVRSYLREFLSDPRVVDLNVVARNLLLYGVILPFRPRKSAHQYQQIWTTDGSPLRVHTESLVSSLASELGDDYVVRYGMRYKNPSIASALEELTNAGCEQIVIAPLFPQYSSAASGSAVERALRDAATLWNTPTITTLDSFYDDPGFTEAVAAVGRPLLDDFDPDYVLFSYHGLPESQVRKSHAADTDCESVGCTEAVGADGRFCYRAQCHATTRSIVMHLGLDTPYETTFQSRMRGQRWIEPYTDVVIERLAASGKRRLAVFTPAFVADCLETLEEIGIRLTKQWQAAGGTDLLLVPCVNDDPAWVRGLSSMIGAKVGAV